MSDRMSNVEIEDVLSAIRRLMSDEPRLQGGPRPRARQGRLMLTPALRIVPESEPANAPPPGPAASAAGPYAPAPHAAVPPPPPPRAASAPEGAARRFRPAPPLPADDLAGGAEAELPLEQRIAELEALLDRREQEFEADEGDRFEVVAEDDAWPAATVTFLRHADRREDQRTAAPEAGATPEAWAEPPPPRHAAEDIGPGTAAAPPPPQDDHRARPVWPEDDDRAPPHRTPGRGPAAAEGEFGGRFDPIGDDATDDAVEDVIDEDTLRDLVREILRDELQGTLGERITRNVRKLVRAEIARALAARDYS
jgi:hypothetical protein